MIKIITLTLCPAFDAHCFCENFAPYHENLAEITSREAGGKGINISRALTQNGVENLAVIALGTENTSDFEALLKMTDIRYVPLYRTGRIRENFTLHTPKKDETRISFTGFSADEALLAETEAIIEREIGDNEAIVTLTGRVPDGIPMHAVKAFLGRLQARGYKLVVDSKSFSKDDILEVRPWLIKPNEEEIDAYADKAPKNEAELIQTARELSARGIENVMITLGAHGAILACSEGIFRATPPKIDALSTIGAGDSSIAGFLAAYQAGLDTSDCLKNAIAYGCAACLTEGTHPPLAEDIKKSACQISVTKIF